MQATDSDVRELRDLILSMDKKIDVFMAQNTEQLKRIEQRVDLVEVNLTQRMDFMNQRIESLEKTIQTETTALETRLNAQDARIWGVVAGVVIALFGLLTKVAFFPGVRA